MRHPDRPLIASLVLALGIPIAVAVGPVALADPKELAAVPAAPVGTSEAAGEPVPKPEPAAVPMTGLQVYKEICIACHTPPGLGGAPALGDSDAWAARIAQGMDTLIDHALHGYSGSTGIMPRKGGRLDLSDEEIIRAIEYMVDQADQ